MTPSVHHMGEPLCVCFWWTIHGNLGVTASSAKWLNSYSVHGKWRDGCAAENYIATSVVRVWALNHLFACLCVVELGGMRRLSDEREVVNGNGVTCQGKASSAVAELLVSVRWYKYGCGGASPTMAWRVIESCREAGDARVMPRYARQGWAVRNMPG